MKMSQIFLFFGREQCDHYQCGEVFSRVQKFQETQEKAELVQKKNTLGEDCNKFSLQNALFFVTDEQELQNSAKSFEALNDKILMCNGLYCEATIRGNITKIIGSI